MDVEEPSPVRFGWVDYFLGDKENVYAAEDGENDDSEKFLVDENSDVDIP